MTINKHIADAIDSVLKAAEVNIEAGETDDAKRCIGSARELFKTLYMQGKQAGTTKPKATTKPPQTLAKGFGVGQEG